MNYIDVDKIKLENNEKLNQLLICLICRGVLLDPMECSKCQRGYCSGCLSQLDKRKCSVCNNLTFLPPHIQTKHNLEEITFETLCCKKVMSYNEYHNHFSDCPNSIQCVNTGCTYSDVKERLDRHLKICPFKKITCHVCNGHYFFKDMDTHMPSCIDKAKNEVNIPIVTHNFVDDINALNVQTDPGRCQKCKINNQTLNCHKCKKNICTSCAGNNNILTIFGLLECNKKNAVQSNEVKTNVDVNAIVQENAKEGGKPFTGCFLFQQFKSEMSDGGFVCFLIFYIILGWLLDLFMMISYLIIFLYFLAMVIGVGAAIIPVFLVFYYLIFAPIYYISWITCFKRRRKCVVC
jgi:hypothetical protein